MDCSYRLDFLVANKVVIEIKAIEVLQPIHTAQVLTYLKWGNWSVGLLINFFVPVLKDGIKRIVHNFADDSAFSASLRLKKPLDNQFYE